MPVSCGQFCHPFVQRFLDLGERLRGGLRVLAQCFLQRKGELALALEILAVCDVIENNTDVP